MLKSHIRKIAMSALFTITLATMGLPFYGYYGVSEIPGFAALFAHRILLSSSDPAVFSNPFVFVISILLYFGNVWWVKSGKTSGLLPKLLAILPMCL
ncbi:MAG: hypothetical protein LBQ15_13580, partial [Clostridium sp.]|nr:hypothetical protein [Clostridium sp.]